MEICLDKYNLAFTARNSLLAETRFHGNNSKNIWTAATASLHTQSTANLTSGSAEHKANSEFHRELHHNTPQYQIKTNSVNRQVPVLDYKAGNFNQQNSADLSKPQVSSPAVGCGRRILPADRRPQISPPPGLEHKRTDLLDQSDEHMQFQNQNPLLPLNVQLHPSVNNLELSQTRMSPASTLPVQWNSLSPPYTPWSTDSTTMYDGYSDSDDSSEISTSHPNKYPVQIEQHDNKFCGYKRQTTRSGEKIKQKIITTYDPITLEQQTSLQKTKHYQKHIVRICRCGRYQLMDGALQQGRANDCNGYEIHYNQKCRWKAYDDMVTGKRVLIRLCKCYRPFG